MLEQVSCQAIFPSQVTQRNLVAMRIGGSLQSGDLIWLETPLNPTCQVADIKAYVAVAKTVPGVRVVVDGTLLAGAGNRARARARAQYLTKVAPN